MNKTQARILLINARVLQLLPYRDNKSFLPIAIVELAKLTDE